MKVTIEMSQEKIKEFLQEGYSSGAVLSFHLGNYQCSLSKEEKEKFYQENPGRLAPSEYVLDSELTQFKIIKIEP